MSQFFIQVTVFWFIFSCLTQTFKRRNGGRNKHGRGHVNFIRCSNCGKCCPKVWNYTHLSFYLRFIAQIFKIMGRTKQSRDFSWGTLSNKLLSGMSRRLASTKVLFITEIDFHFNKFLFFFQWHFLDWYIFYCVDYFAMSSGYTLPKLYAKMQYCVSCAIHSHVVRVRSRENRRNREPPQRFRRKVCIFNFVSHFVFSHCCKIGSFMISWYDLL